MMKLKMNMKSLMITIMLMSTMMAISSTNMLMMWSSMELNMFSFTPLLMNKATINEIETSINYFLPQALGSMIFLMSWIMLLSSHSMLKTNYMLLMMAILLKLGAAPCHYWYPLIMEKTTWSNCLLLSTWQKAAPLFIMFFIISSTTINMFMIVVFMNAMTGGIMGLSHPSMKKIMSYSSITHMSWMLSGMMMNSINLSILYFLMYSFIATPLFMLFNKMNTNLLYELWQKKMQTTNMVSTVTMLMSIGGLPPLTGFIPKLMMLNALLNYSMMTSIMLITSSIMNLYFYLNISMNMMMAHQKNNMLIKSMKKSMQASMNTMLSMNLLGILFMI